MLELLIGCSNNPLSDYQRKVHSRLSCIGLSISAHVSSFLKKEIVILKLDLEKALDKVEHHVIIGILRGKGFSENWIGWIQSLLSSGSSSVLLNRVPGKSFQCKRGVRQGDQLSPLLFVLAAYLLQSIVNKAANLEVLKHPLGQSFQGDYPVIQYVDDTLIVMPADARQLLAHSSTAYIC